MVIITLALKKIITLNCLCQNKWELFILIKKVMREKVKLTNEINVVISKTN